MLNIVKRLNTFQWCEYDFGSQVSGLSVKYFISHINDECASLNTGFRSQCEGSKVGVRSPNQSEAFHFSVPM